MRRRNSPDTGTALIRVLALPVLERAFGMGGIVAYHGVTQAPFLPSTHVTPGALQSQLEFLASHYTVVPLTEFVERRKHRRSLRRCVAVTFDDAYAGVLHHGLPILQRLGIPATVFVATSFCRGNKRFWWDRLEWATQRLEPAARFEMLRRMDLGDEPAPQDVRDHVLTHFRGALPLGMDRALRGAEELVGLVPERAMSAQELLQLAQSDLIDFGPHSAHHYALPSLAPGKAEKEIRLAYDWLRERLPRVRPYLAYPYGLYTHETMDAARRSGMEVAFSISGRAATSRFPAYACPRVGMADVNNLEGLRLRLSWITIPIVAWQGRGWINERVRTPARRTGGAGA